MLDIELVDNESIKQAEEQAKKAIFNNPTISDPIATIARRILKASNVDISSKCKKDIENMIMDSINYAFDRGKAFGTKEIIKVKGDNSGYIPKREEVYRERTDHYAGD